MLLFSMGWNFVSTGKIANKSVLGIDVRVQWCYGEVAMKITEDKDEKRRAHLNRHKIQVDGGRLTAARIRQG